MASDSSAVAAVGISSEELAWLVESTDPPPLMQSVPSAVDAAGRQEAFAGLLARGILSAVGPGSPLMLSGPEAGVLATAMVADDALLLSRFDPDDTTDLAFYSADGALVCQRTDARGHTFARVDREWAAAALSGFVGPSDDGVTEDVVAVVDRDVWVAVQRAASASAATALMPEPAGLAASVWSADRVVHATRVGRSPALDLNVDFVLMYFSYGELPSWLIIDDQDAEVIGVRQLSGGVLARFLAELLP